VRPVLAAGYALTALGFSATGLATTVPLLVGTVVIWTFGEMVESPVAAAFVAGLAPEHMRGRYQGTWTSMFALSFIIGPAVGSLLFQSSEPALWLACAALPLLSAAFVLSIPRRRVEEAHGPAAATPPAH
jgi:MFS family permease